MEESQSHINNSNEQKIIDSFYKYEGRLIAFALKIIRSESLVKDVLQEVFLSLWVKKDKLSEIENLEAYLYRATKNKAIDFLRALANDNKLRSDYFSTIEKEDHAVEKVLALKEGRELLESAMSELPQKRKQIYELSQVYGLSRKEIAEKMKISESTVKNQLTSAHSSIRDFLLKCMKSLFSFF